MTSCNSAFLCTPEYLHLAIVDFAHGNKHSERVLPQPLTNLVYSIAPAIRCFEDSNVLVARSLYDRPMAVTLSDSIFALRILSHRFA